MEPQTQWRANGKLLITGEYLVMEGADAFAVPLIKGQSLQVRKTGMSKHPVLIWQAQKPDGLWFETRFSMPALQILHSTNREKANHLKKILQTARSINPSFLNEKESFHVKTELEFPPEYGFGSSSTLIATLAHWANINPFLLQRKALGGSAYDVACAGAKRPLIYHLKENHPAWQEVSFQLAFTKNLYFVYLGKKQNSAQGIQYFKEKAHFSNTDILEITSLTHQCVEAEDLDTFTRLLQEHEEIVSRILKKPKVKNLYFEGIETVVKSLGAWGGDFVLCATKIEEKDFRRKLKSFGFSVIFAWNQLVLNV